MPLAFCKVVSSGCVARSSSSMWVWPSLPVYSRMKFPMSDLPEPARPTRPSAGPAAAPIVLLIENRLRSSQPRQRRTVRMGEREQLAAPLAIREARATEQKAQRARRRRGRELGNDAGGLVREPDDVASLRPMRQNVGECLPAFAAHVAQHSRVKHHKP